MPAPPTFGEWLQARRVALDMTQESLAAKLGCTLSMLKKIEGGRRRPSRQLAELMVPALSLAATEAASFVAVARAQAPASSLPPPVPLPPTNLFAPLLPLIGREAELAALADRVQHSPARWITLTGPAGVGKSYLAIALARHLRSVFPDGVWWVELVHLTEAAECLGAVAQALGLQEETARSTSEQLLAYLQHKTLLVILDNVEHIPAAAPRMTTLLQAAPGLTLVATSRRSLGVAGEHLFPLGPLALPPAEELPLERLATVPAVRLFMDRVRAVRPTWNLTADNQASVVAICRALDGLPLALELAAIRSKHLPLAQLYAMLSHSLSHLAAPARQVPPHQRSLRATLEWSYALLSPEEQQLFARLSCLVAPFTPEAAFAVGGDPAADPATSHLRLESLANQSLLQPFFVGQQVYFRWLNTLREFAGEKLTQSGEARRIEQRVIGYYSQLADSFPEPPTAATLRQIDPMLPNLRAAMAYALAHEEPIAAARIATSLWRFWWTRHYLAEGREWLERCLAQQAALPPPLLALVYNAAGILAWSQHDWGQARAWLHEALRCWEQIGNPHRKIAALNNLGLVAMSQGDYEVAADYYHTCLTALEGGAFPPLYRVSVLGNLGLTRLRQGALDEAIEQLRAGVALTRASGEEASLLGLLIPLGSAQRYRGDYRAATTTLTSALVLAWENQEQLRLMHALVQMGYLALAEGQPEAARDWWLEGLRLSQAHEDQNVLALTLEGLAQVAYTLGTVAEAWRLWQAAQALRQARCLPLFPVEQASHERFQAQLAQAITEPPAPRPLSALVATQLAQAEATPSLAERIAAL